MSLFEKTIPVLMYHRINRPDPRSSLVVSPQSFYDQFRWLEENRFRFLSLDEVVDRGGKTSFWNREVALTFDDGFRDNYENAFPLLIEKKRPAALFVVVNWVGQDDYLNWQEIRELSRQGVLIGSHSLSHRWLPDIEDSRELEHEIASSKKKIEDKIGQGVKHFCYPVGGVSKRVTELVQKVGYRAAWVAGARPNIHPKNSSLCIRRQKVTPSDSNLIHFAVKAYGWKSMLW